jgi:hypothetical protein
MLEARRQKYLRCKKKHVVYNPTRQVQQAFARLTICSAGVS